MLFIISTSMLIATVDSIDSTEYYFIINLKKIDKLMVLCLFETPQSPHKIRNSGRSWTLFKNYCQLIVFVPPINKLNFFFFFFILNAHQEKSTQYKIIDIIIILLLLNLKKHPRIFCSITIAKFKKNKGHQEKIKIYFCNFSILYRQRFSEKS